MSLMHEQSADLTGWYWHPGAQQPVYISWQDDQWWVRWYEPPAMSKTALDEPLTPSLLLDLHPLSDTSSHARHVGT